MSALRWGRGGRSRRASEATREGWPDRGPEHHGCERGGQGCPGGHVERAVTEEHVGVGVEEDGEVAVLDGDLTAVAFGPSGC